MARKRKKRDEISLPGLLMVIAFFGAFSFTQSVGATLIVTFLAGCAIVGPVTG